MLMGMFNESLQLASELSPEALKRDLVTAESLDCKVACAAHLSLQKDPAIKKWIQDLLEKPHAGGIEPECIGILLLAFEVDPSPEQLQLLKSYLTPKDDRAIGLAAIAANLLMINRNKMSLSEQIECGELSGRTLLKTRGKDIPTNVVTSLLDASRRLRNLKPQASL